MTDYHYEKDPDGSALWLRESRPASHSGVPRLKRWWCPILTAVVLLLLIIILGACYMKVSNHLSSVEERVSSLNKVVDSLSISLQRAQETAKDVQQLKFSANYTQHQLASVSDALKHLAAIDSLSRSVASLKCSLERVINNGSAAGGCCPLGWVLSGFNCYFFSHTTLSWNESRIWCEQQNAHLVIILTDEDWDFVTRRTIPEWFWVGLSDWKRGRWEWINDTPYTIERRRWKPGQPDSWTNHGLGEGDEDCAHLHNDGRLNDLHCSHKMRYICQKHSLHN